MNKRIDFSFTGGFPVTEETFDFMQTSFRAAFGALASMIGDKVIISGADILGNNISDGWISYNGELLPFIGGPKAGAGSYGVIINETAVAKVFDDGNAHNVYFTKVATLGSPSLFPFSDLMKLDQLKFMGVPVASVLDYVGAANDIPVNYGLCDGGLLNISDYPSLFARIGTTHGGDGVTTFAKPDMSGLFKVGLSGTDADFNVIGKKGGLKERVINILNLAPFTLKLPFKKSDNAFGGGGNNVPVFDGNYPSGSPFNYGGGITTQSAGGNQPLDMKPPYFTLAYILKLK